MAGDLKSILLGKCAKFPNIDAIILTAIAEVESSWRPSVMKYEPSFTYLYKPQEFALKHGIDLPTERCLQRFSYGIGQIMGGTCRGLGFDGFLTELLDPCLNMDYMIKFFQQTCGKYIYASDKIAAYNAGSVHRLLSDGRYVNQGYVDKVLAVLEKDPTWKAAQVALPLSGRPN